MKAQTKSNQKSFSNGYDGDSLKTKHNSLHTDRMVTSD